MARIMKLLKTRPTCNEALEYQIVVVCNQTIDINEQFCLMLQKCYCIENKSGPSRRPFSG